VSKKGVFTCQKKGCLRVQKEVSKRAVEKMLAHCFKEKCTNEKWLVHKLHLKENLILKKNAQTKNG
jgi:hypothetical protein